MRFLLCKLFCVLFLCSFAIAQQPKFTISPTIWKTDELGNIRVVIQVKNAAKVAFAKIEWRRRDKDPTEKNVIVTDSIGKIIKNVKRGEINREFGEIFFEPTASAGTYYVYYLPYKKSGSANYPKDFYPKFEAQADTEWLKSITPTQPNTEVSEIQSIDAFNSFYPMEVIATQTEVRNLMAQNSDKPFLVFPEDRLFSIRMTEDLPQRWIQKGAQKSFSGESRRGEFYAFQFGIYALKDLQRIKVDFSNLTNKKGQSISKDNLTCINTNGVDYRGVNFEKTVDVAKDKVQAIWCGVDVAQNVVGGEYKGAAKITANGETPQEIQLDIKVSDEMAENSGFNEPENEWHSRYASFQRPSGRGSACALMGHRHLAPASS